MPLYEYHCEACGREFEKLVSMGGRNQQVNCPSCGSSLTRRAISVFAAHCASTAGDHVPVDCPTSRRG